MLHSPPPYVPTPEDAAFSRLIAYAAFQWPNYRDAPHHRLIARKLEAVERGDIQRLMITMPPRHGKSMLASEFFPAWYMGRNPDHYVVISTYAQELADDFGRKVKNQIEDEAYQGVFPGVRLADDSRSNKRFHVEQEEGGYEYGLTQPGAFYAVGVGGPLTGRGAHLLLIDDPVKNREDADSEVIRKKTKDWYTSTAYTRLMPGGRVVIIQCMVGSTPVLMADGSEKSLSDIRPGDTVATYDAGRIVASNVVNWANQGSDRVFAIRMTSGITVTANERHPFLVDRNGELEWVRLKNLQVGDKVVRAIGGNGEASLAPTMDVTSRLKRAACACHTTTKPDGQTASGRPRSTQSPGGRLICATGTGSISRNTTLCSPLKVETAQSVVSHPAAMSERIGAGSSALTTTTPLDESGGCCAMTATLPLDTARQRPFSSPQLDTYATTRDTIASIEAAGVEEVFDIQVAGTENFIANGLVSHNTRWHEDDLSGWLLAEHLHEGWEVLNLPAIGDDGQALWPEQYPIAALEKIKLAIGPRDWSALYQQRPAPETGDYFKLDWLRPTLTFPPLNTLHVYGGSDYAVTADGGDFTVHVVVGVDPAGRMYLLDLWRGQTSSEQWVEAFCDLVKKWRPLGWAEETGQIRAGVGPFLTRRMMERQAYVAREQFPTRGDKAVRAQSIRGKMAMHGLYLRPTETWRADFQSELMSFPVGVHDDQVDALGLVGQLIDRMTNGVEPKVAKPKPAPPPGMVVIPGPPVSRSGKRIKL